MSRFGPPMRSAHTPKDTAVVVPAGRGCSHRPTFAPTAAEGYSAIGPNASGVFDARRPVPPMSSIAFRGRRERGPTTPSCRLPSSDKPTNVDRATRELEHVARRCKTFEPVEALEMIAQPSADRATLCVGVFVGCQLAGVDHVRLDLRSRQELGPAPRLPVADQPPVDAHRLREWRAVSTRVSPLVTLEARRRHRFHGYRRRDAVFFFFFPPNSNEIRLPPSTGPFETGVRSSSPRAVGTLS